MQHANNITNTKSKLPDSSIDQNFNLEMGLSLLYSFPIEEAESYKIRSEINETPMVSRFAELFETFCDFYSLCNECSRFEI